MKEKNYQSIIEAIWPDLKRKHLYPEIPMPWVRGMSTSGQDRADEDRGVGLEMKKKQLTIHSAFVSQMKGKMEERKVIEALLDHGITHYTFCPWDFQTYLQFYADAKKVVEDKEDAKRIAGFFMDVIADTHCVKKIATEIPELHRHLKKGKIEEVIASLYQQIWGMDLGVPPSRMSNKSHAGIVRRLARIPYLNRSQWGESIQKFARSLKPLLLEEKEEEGDKGGEKPRPNPQGEHDLTRYSYEEIDRGLREYARETMTLSEFKDVVEDFSQELKEAGYKTGGEMGRGQKSPLDADILFYMKLAENYSIPLKKLPLEKKGTLHPDTHAPWEIGSPYRDVDLWTSFGKIMPGITQVWTRREGRGRGKQEDTPDCLIVIDSSGSMINPRKNLSYAVLGAACAANAYLQNGSKVAVYNFSDAPLGGKYVQGFTKRPEKIYHALCKYFGGGTALEFEDLMPFLQKKNDLDIFVITDMKITNLEALIDFFENIQNRVTAVYIGENPYSARFKKAAEQWENISIFNVKRKEDIPRIVLGSIKEYFHPLP